MHVSYSNFLVLRCFRVCSLFMAERGGGAVFRVGGKIFKISENGGCFFKYSRNEGGGG